MKHRWKKIDRGKTEVLGEKPVPVPLCPPQIPHGLTRDRTRASTVRVRRLTACAIITLLSKIQINQSVNIHYLTCITFLEKRQDGTMSWFRRLVCGLSPLKPRFCPWPARIEYVVDKMALGQVFLLVFLLLLSVSFH
jgi:hypothetical protein